MSSLGYAEMGKLSFKASPVEVFAPWVTHARMKATKKEQDRLRKKDKFAQAMTAEQEAQRREDELRKIRLIQDLQKKVATKLKILESEAELATQHVIKIRQLATAPILQDSDLAGLEESLVDIEKAVVTIQAATVVEVGSADTKALAEAHGNASSGYVAMRVLTSRVVSIQKALEQKIKDLTDEQIRLQLAQAAAVEERAVARREQRQFEEQRQYEREQLALEASRRSRRDLTGQILEVDRELSRSKRRLGVLRVELANLRFSKSNPSLAGGCW